MSQYVPSLKKRLTLLSSERAFPITHAAAEKTVKNGIGVTEVLLGSFTVWETLFFHSTQD